MTRRFALRWMRPLLPLLLLRLLVPTGLMLAPGEHGAALILCSMEGPQGSAVTDMSGMDMSGMDMGGMDMSASRADGGSLPAHTSNHKETVCPFAAVASFAPVPALPPIARLQVAVTLLTLPRAVSQRAAPSGPLRSQISRAPPAYS